jgi:hypothetical protein
MAGEKAHAFCRRLLREGDGGGIAQRFQPRQLLIAGGRNREIRYRVYDAIEFKRAESVLVQLSYP